MTSRDRTPDHTLTHDNGRPANPYGRSPRVSATDFSHSVGHSAGYKIEETPLAWRVSPGQRGFILRARQDSNLQPLDP